MIAMKLDRVEYNAGRKLGGNFKIGLACSTEAIYKYGLLTKRERKIAGYWPSFFASLWTLTPSRSILTSNKKKYSAILPSRLQDSVHLARSWS